ncbi:hypothetical protein C0Q70_18374 [Pomacea canaliculata]|uniref:Uncharacterized protein n=1 Tax=Pomacea canaliculata TaxID=400727 RepID=A0A2T7NN17_POMCA|nr:hypothetical protein C0Q70_18374 [Pomacea canaliculata]
MTSSSPAVVTGVPTPAPRVWPTPPPAGCSNCGTADGTVNGGWSSWSTLREGECSATCGGGIRVRTSTRSCSNPYPTYCGVTCPGSATRNEQVACNTHCCPGVVSGTGSHNYPE